MMVVLVNFPYRKLLVGCIAIDPYLFHVIVKGPHGADGAEGQSSGRTNLVAGLCTSARHSWKSMFSNSASVESSALGSIQ